MDYVWRTSIERGEKTTMKRRKLHKTTNELRYLVAVSAQLRYSDHPEYLLEDWWTSTS
jgi:hypothetical protein